MYIRESLNCILFFHAKNKRCCRNIKLGGKKENGTKGSRI